MKKLLTYAIAAVVLVACNKGPDVDGNVNDVTGNSIAFKGSAVTDGENKGTRISVEDGELGLDFAWEKSTDLIGIFANDANEQIKANASYKASSTGAVSAFSPSSAGDAITWGEGSHDFYAYFPYNADAGTDITKIPVSVPAAQTQVAATPAHLGPVNFLYATATGIEESAGEVELRFHHLFAVLNVKLKTAAGTGITRVSALKFRSTDETEALAFDGTFDFGTGKYTVTEDTKSNEITLTFQNPMVIRETEELDAYMLISPGHAGKEFEVAAVVVDKADEIVVATKSAPDNGVGFPASKMAVLNAEIAGEGENPISSVYIFGTAAGGNLGSSSFVMVADDENPLVFSYEGDFAAGEFAFAVNSTGEDAEYLISTASGKGNLRRTGIKLSETAASDTEYLWQLAYSGRHKVVVNTEDMTIHIERLDVTAIYAVGDCINGWNTGAPGTFVKGEVYNTFVLEHHLKTGGANSGMKFYINQSSWSATCYKPLNSEVESKFGPGPVPMSRSGNDADQLRWTVTEEMVGDYVITIDVLNTTATFEGGPELQ